MNLSPFPLGIATGQNAGLSSIISPLILDAISGVTGGDFRLRGNGTMEEKSTVILLRERRPHLLREGERGRIAAL